VRSWLFALAALMVGATLAFTDARARQPETAPAKPLADLPRSFGEWRATRDLPIADRELDLLKLSDYVSRAYASDRPGTGAAFLYIGYYRTQRTGATYHSPLNCLPGTGYQVDKIDYLAVTGVPGAQVKRLIMQKEMQRDVVLYWYQDRGRILTSEYAAKAWLIWDGLWLNRTDGSLVRILVPAGTGSTDAATDAAIRFLSDLWPHLAERLAAPPRS